MSAIPQPVSTGLSDSILRPLREVARRSWVAIAGRGLLQVLAISLLVWLIAVALVGYFAHMPASLRIVLSVTAWGTLVASLVYFLRPALVRRSLRSAAIQVESSQSDTQELISSAVELSTDIDPRYAGSSEMVAHLVKQAEVAARAVKPTDVVSYRGMKLWGVLAAPVLVAWALLLPMWPGPMWRGLAHIVAPWRGVMAIDRARLIVTPGDVAILEGDPLQITAVIIPQTGGDDVTSASVQFRYPTGQSSSADMASTTARTFALGIEHVVAAGEYSVATPAGDSPWYRITLRHRPAVAGITVKYNYPKYTRLPVKIDNRLDGAVDAVVGTAVQLTIHCTTPLDGKSRIIFKEEGPDAADEQSLALLPAADATGNDYSADLLLARSGAYRIELIGTDGLTGPASSPHLVTVRPERPPVISIVAPAVKISLPPDDTVPVVFHASDDFGVARVEAIVQVDGQSPEVFNVPLAMRGGREQQGSWKLSIPYLLARHTLTDATQIVYQLRATNTRQPEPLTTLTPRQIINVDHSFKESTAANKEAAAVKDLTEAIKKAIKELTEEGKTIDPMASAKTPVVFSAMQKRTTSQLKDAVVKTGKDLGDVADANVDGPMADIATAAQRIVNGSIYGAGDELALAIIAAEAPARQKSITASAAKIIDAKTQLEALLAQLQKEAKTEELARALQDMARHEEQVAKALEKKEAAKNPDRNREVQNQVELRQRLDEVLNKNKELNTPQVREAAQRNQQLIQKVEQLEQQQKPLEPLADRQQAVNDAQAKVSDFAQKQEALNQKVAEFAKDNQPQTKQANAAPPQQAQLEKIVKELKDPNQVPQANAEQRQSASELKTAAQRLQNAANDGSPLAQAEQRDKQDADRAGQLEQQAKDVGKQIADSQADESRKTDVNRARDLANQAKQQDAQLANQLAQQANEMKARDPKQKDAIDAAAKEIADAKNEIAPADAGLDQAADADQKLADAAEKLAAAATQAQDQADEARKEAAATGEKADALAQEQKDLADETAKAVQGLAQARQQQGNDQALQQGEQQASQQADQTANEAGQAQQQEQKAAPDLAKRAADAKTALADAAAHEKKAAEAAKNKDAATAGEEQKAAEKSLAQAEQALRGGPDAGADVAAGDAHDPNGDPTPAADGDPNAAGDKADAAKADGTGDKPDAGQGDAAAKPAGDANADKGDPANADANADGAGKPDAGADAAGPQSGKGKGPKGASSPAAAGDPPKSAEQLQQDAAEQVQAARQAQDEAVGGRPAAAHQAAAALAQAAHDLEQAMHPDAGQQAGKGDPSSPQSSGPTNPASPSQSQAKGNDAGSDPGNEPGSDPASGAGQQPGKSPQSQSKDGHGIDVTAVAKVDSRPDEIRQMGVSASDWARLPPLTKQDMLNAARQGGPPEYQEQIKKYFVKIAKLQAEGAK